MPLFSAQRDDTLHRDIHCSRVRPPLGELARRRGREDAMRRAGVVLFVVGYVALIFSSLARMPEPERMPMRIETGASVRPLPPFELPASVPEEPDVLALAQVCRHESGFPARRDGRWDFGGDCAAINAVLEFGRARLELARRRSDPEDWEPVTFEDFARRYSDRVFDRSRTSGPCDAAWLTIDGRAPACWDSTVPWKDRRAAWLALVDHARDIRLGTITHACERPPAHWGCGDRETERGCGDHDRATRAGWRRISCGRTDNRFYYAPELERFARLLE